MKFISIILASCTRLTLFYRLPYASQSNGPGPSNQFPYQDQGPPMYNNLGNFSENHNNNSFQYNSDESLFHAGPSTSAHKGTSHLFQPQGTNDNYVTVDMVTVNY